MFFSFFCPRAGHPPPSKKKEALPTEANGRSPPTPSGVDFFLPGAAHHGDPVAAPGLRGAV